MNQPKILVTGATGKTGGAVARELLAAGWPVRALARSEDARSEALARLGAEIFTGDLFDLDSMRRALQGTRRAYVLPPFGMRLAQATAVFTQAAAETGLESMVAMGQWLASPTHPALLTRDLWEMERVFMSLPGVACTMVNPGFFADNYLRLIGFAALLGVLPSLTGDSRNAPPSNEDIARVAVAALADPARHAGQRYRPAGPEMLSTADMARILSDVLGHRVRRLEMPMWLFLKAARMQGVSEDEMSGFRYWVQDHKQGAFAFGAPNGHVLEVTGRPPENFADIARRYAARPDAKRTTASRSRAILDFLRTPLAPGYDLDAYDRAHGAARPPGARLAMQDPNWVARRTAEAARPAPGVRDTAA